MMAENKNNINNPEEKEVKETKNSSKAKETKPKEKKPNIFKKFAKLCKDTVGELKKVVWTPKLEVWKSFKLVIATVVAVSVIILIVDVASSSVVNFIAGLIG